MSALVMKEVRKVYGSGETEVVALDHASIAVGDDEMVALVGPSGSGKTTLLSIAGGLLLPTEGVVRVGPHEITEYGRKELTTFRRGSVGFVFQGANLVPFLTARENLLVVADLAGRRGKDVERRADRLLQELGLTHRARNTPSALSGGERQRVAIGRALMNEPELVLFDEPTSALDTKLGEQVMELIRTEVKERGTAAIIVTHDTRMTHFADRTVEISDGRLAA
jgi:putative ABC transport system ATP-binding protein